MTEGQVFMEFMNISILELTSSQVFRARIYKVNNELTQITAFMKGLQEKQNCQWLGDDICLS